MSELNFALLKSLCETPGISGSEQPMLRLVATVRAEQSISSCFPVDPPAYSTSGSGSATVTSTVAVPRDPHRMHRSRSSTSWSLVAGCRPALSCHSRIRRFCLQNGHRAVSRWYGWRSLRRTA